LSKFAELGLDQKLVDALSDLSIVKPTEIQEKAIPHLISSMGDFIGLAQTGTGKTAAFGLPLLHMIDEDVNACQAVILAPTRELAQQIAEGIKSFSKYKKKIKTECVFGGAAIINQIKALKAKPQVIVATPGRLVDLIKRKVVLLNALNYVILDEADEMLNMGFKEELNKILEVTPDDKTTWLFSATMPKAIKHIVNEYMNDPFEISVKSGVEVNKNISHQYMVVKVSDKVEAVRRIIDMNPNFYGLMFCRTKIDTQNLAEEIGRSGYKAEALHGDLTQKQRDVVMRKFKEGRISLLVATDVAARGIDVNDLTHVIHHRLPDEMEFYTHRSGRTARAGKKGISVVLVSKGEVRKIRDIEKRLKITFEKNMVPTSLEVQQIRIDGWARQLVEYQIKKEPAADIKEVVDQAFSSLTKEDLVAKLLDMEMSKYGSSESHDINMTETSSRSGDGASRGGNRTHDKIFINVGKIDQFSNAELLHMICDVSLVKKSDVGKIDIQQKASYFEVPKEISKTIIDKFDGYLLDDRPIRVNIEKGSVGRDRERGRDGKRSFSGDRDRRRRSDQSRDSGRKRRR
jgi:ATP-dependent RNA helicase DeaD